MTAASIEILEHCRSGLQDIASTPPDVAHYANEISEETGVARELIAQLREAEERRAYLEGRMAGAKDLPNKMEYSNAVNELSVAANKIAELTHSVQHSVRTYEAVVANTKRLSLEMERLDDLLFISQHELDRVGDVPTLREVTDEHVPLARAREEALAGLKETNRELGIVRKALRSEKDEHAEEIQDTKTKIKHMRRDLRALESGTYKPAVDFEKKLEAEQRAADLEHESRLEAVRGEIGQLKAELEQGRLDRESSLKALDAERFRLEEEMAATARTHAESMAEAEAALADLQRRKADNRSVLSGLEGRWEAEQRELAALRHQEERRLAAIEVERAREEKEYFAALWIQLRWKAHLKRVASKQSKQKKKGGKKKGVKKKKVN